MENRMSFYDVDYNEMDRDLSPEQLREWTSIYASYRSRTPLTGIVVGVVTHSEPMRIHSDKTYLFSAVCARLSALTETSPMLMS